jgi:hypothetical protein
MTAVMITARRVAYGTGVAALLLSLCGCAGGPRYGGPRYVHVESTPETVIRAEDAEQVPIQETSAAEAASRCGENPSNSGAWVECSADGVIRALESVLPAAR